MRAQHLWQIAVLCLCAGTLTACPTERFRHEKYQCNSGSFGIAAIILNDTGVGDDATIIGYGNEKTAEITASSASSVALKLDGGKLTIDRDSGEVTLKRGKRYIVMSCTKSVFTM